MTEGCVCEKPKSKKNKAPQQSPQPCSCMPPPKPKCCPTPESKYPPKPCPPPLCSPAPCPKPKEFNMMVDLPTGRVLLKAKSKPIPPRMSKCPPAKLTIDDVVKIKVNCKEVCINDYRHFSDEFKTSLGKLFISLVENNLVLEGFADMLEEAYKML